MYTSDYGKEGHTAIRLIEIPFGVSKKIRNTSDVGGTWSVLDGPDGDVLMRARVESHLTEFFANGGHVNEEFFGGQQQQDAVKDLFG